MHVSNPTNTLDTRRGVILMVVLALLTLFAILGLSFVLYADSSARSGQISREAESAVVKPNVDLDPDALFAFLMGQLLLPVDDTVAGVYSGLRGHDLARNMYGYNPATYNGTPFNGVGRLHGNSPISGVDDYNLINFTYFSADNFLRDPERFGARANLGAAPAAWTGGFNAPYTYPDLNNLFLAAVDPGGNVLLPSFHRPWLFGSNDPNANPNWMNQQGRYLTLRPRPVDHTPAFPYPEDSGGDVKNLIGAPGGNDSYWVDPGFPVVVAPNGKKFKALAAFLVMDLDSKINLNIHGNNGKGNGHVSNQGWGPWTVNLGQVLRANATEAQQILTGTMNPRPPYGRYGNLNKAPADGSMALAPFMFNVPPLAATHNYAGVDFDGSDDSGNPTGVLAPPYVNTAPGPAGCFPVFSGGYGNLMGAELNSHPILYNPFGLASDDRTFPTSSMEALLRYGDTGSAALDSELFRLSPSNFLGNDPNIKRWVTVRSFDVERPGVTPYVPATGASSGYQLAMGALYPRGVPLSFPPVNTLNALPNSEFAVGDGRDLYASALGRLDLNRPLPNYPTPDVNSGQYNPADLPTFYAAQVARQDFAKDIFDRLRLATGAADPMAVAAGTPDFDALRWLAQLAVNIVDFIDNDEVSTPFNWYTAAGNPPPGSWVFGTEIPRVVVNEAYAEFTPMMNGMQDIVNVWVELYNPLNPDANFPPFNGDAFLPGAYQIVLCQPGTGAQLRLASNTTGDLSSPAPVFIPGSGLTNLPGAAGTDFTGATFKTIKAAGGSAADNTNTNNGYYVVGPAPIPQKGGTPPQPTFLAPTMTYQTQGQGMPLRPIAPTIVLQRLACPYRPFNATPGPDYNPYITVDYMENVDGDGTAQNLIINENRTKDQLPPNNPNPETNRIAVGRLQPLAGIATQLAPEAAMPPNQPRNTFWQKNQPANQTFDWFYHFDRPLTSIMDVLHVSALKPQELTQEFIHPMTALQPYNHRAPWFDEDITPPGSASHRLWRFFEFVTTRSLVGATAALPNPNLPYTTAASNINAGAGVTVTPAAMSIRSPNGAVYSFQAGDVVAVEPGSANQETVRVQAVAPMPPQAPTAFVATFYKSHAQGSVILFTTMGDRVAGKINVNTMWDPPADPRTLLALCDPQNSNNFTATDVANIFNTLVSQRTPGDMSKGIPPGTPSGMDRPFIGHGTGLYGSGDTQFPNYSIENTVLRSLTGAGGQRLFETYDPSSAANTHPYWKYQLLSKISNNLTTRSNVFAVWMTVGFFEVVDDTTRPVKLGAEVGRTENRHIRHRFFSIVDRTNLKVPSLLLDSSNNPAVLGNPAGPGASVIQPTTVTGLLNPGGIPWTIQQGTVLSVGTGSGQEAVTVASVNGNNVTLTSGLSKTHPAGDPITLFVLPGNMGVPGQGINPKFNPRDPIFSPVVPYYSIIQ